MSTDGISIDVWGGEEQHLGQIGHASRPTRILGRASAEAGIDSVSYAINGRGRFPVSVGPSAFRLGRDGDFCLEFSRDRLVQGENVITLWANDREGAELESQIKIHIDKNTRWPLPFETDWANAERPQDLCEIADGCWGIEHGGLRTLEPGYDRMVAIGDVRWRHYEITATVTIHDVDRSPRVLGWPSMGPAFGVQVRWEGHHDWGDIKPARGWFPFGAMARLEHDEDLPESEMRFRLRGPGFVEPLAAEAHGRHVEPGMSFVFRVASQTGPDGRGVYGASVWHADEPEPETPQLTARGLDRETPAGSAVIMAHHTDVTIGRVRAEPLG
ncbi:MAG: hypothetical protein AAGK04_10685 [Planctomycetota bacterium]